MSAQILEVRLTRQQVDALLEAVLFRATGGLMGDVEPKHRILQELASYLVNIQEPQPLYKHDERDALYLGPYFELHFELDEDSMEKVTSMIRWELYAEYIPKRGGLDFHSFVARYGNKPSDMLRRSTNTTIGERTPEPFIVASARLLEMAKVEGRFEEGF